MKLFLAFTGMITLTVTDKLLLKTGADSLNADASLWVRLFSWRLLLGLTLFGCAALIYVAILGWLPLHIASSFAAAQYIAVILAFFLCCPKQSALYSGGDSTHYPSNRDGRRWAVIVVEPACVALHPMIRIIRVGLSLVGTNDLTS